MLVPATLTKMEMAFSSGDRVEPQGRSLLLKVARFLGPAALTDSVAPIPNTVARLEFSVLSKGLMK